MPLYCTNRREDLQVAAWRHQVVAASLRQRRIETAVGDEDVIHRVLVRLGPHHSTRQEITYRDGTPDSHLEEAPDLFAVVFRVRMIRCKPERLIDQIERLRAIAAEHWNGC